METTGARSMTQGQTRLQEGSSKLGILAYCCIRDGEKALICQREKTFTRDASYMVVQFDW